MAYRTVHPVHQRCHTSRRPPDVILRRRPGNEANRKRDESLVVSFPGCVGLGMRHDSRIELTQAAIDLESEYTLVLTDEFFSAVFSCACL